MKQERKKSEPQSPLKVYSPNLNKTFHEAAPLKHILRESWEGMKPSMHGSYPGHLGIQILKMAKVLKMYSPTNCTRIFPVSVYLPITIRKSRNNNFTVWALFVTKISQPLDVV